MGGRRNTIWQFPVQDYELKHRRLMPSLLGRGKKIKKRNLSLRELLRLLLD